MAKKKDLYRILGVNQKADSSKIKKAYRRAAKKYHPDISPKGEEKFKEVQEAYETLSDPEKKADYDLGIKKKSVSHSSAEKYSQPLRPTPLRSGPLHFFDEIDQVFSEFEDFWVRRPIFLCDWGKEYADHLSVEITLTPAEARNGCEVPLEIPLRAGCRLCLGASFVEGFICSDCRGRRERRIRKKLHMIIPPGVKDGTQLIIPLNGRESRSLDLIATLRIE